MYCCRWRFAHDTTLDVPWPRALFADGRHDVQAQSAGLSSLNWFCCCSSCWRLHVHSSERCWRCRSIRYTYGSGSASKDIGSLLLTFYEFQSTFLSKTNALLSVISLPDHYIWFDTPITGFTAHLRFKFYPYLISFKFYAVRFLSLFKTFVYLS